jgi:glycosyltransferase involved in cell wall biosynthesis
LRFLFCCELYFPSVGGVQEVMRQIAERMVKKGHEVTVVTSKLPDRGFQTLNGVNIKEFNITGNQASGMSGDTKRYQDFVVNFPADVILIKAAQQWTFDALWPVLPSINTRKVFIPCGFSGLYEPIYHNYFEKLPQVIEHIDHLIFYSENYRDINFLKDKCCIENKFSILTNGACEVEFNAPPQLNFRKDQGIPEDSVVLLTVGSLTSTKGHKELLEAFNKIDLDGRHITLILNAKVSRNTDFKTLAYPVRSSLSANIDKTFCIAKRKLREFKNIIKRVIKIMIFEGIAGIHLRVLKRLRPIFPDSGHSQADRQLNRTGLTVLTPFKTLIVSDYERADLIQAYFAANLFVFASSIEYSPLVLFESAAAGTPFLSVPVGNACEIAQQTGCGIICPAEQNAHGYTEINTDVLARHIVASISDSVNLIHLGKQGRKNWSEKFTWQVIAAKYEKILCAL